MGKKVNLHFIYYGVTFLFNCLRNKENNLRYHHFILDRNLTCTWVYICIISGEKLCEFSYDWKNGENKDVLINAVQIHVSVSRK